MITLLTEDMIRITTASLGANGRILRERPFHVFVGHHALKDERGRLRRFGRRSAAIAAARLFIVAHNQTLLPETTTPRWTRQGRVLSLDGVEAIHVERVVDEHSNAKLSPVTCDAIADLVHRTLNEVDLDALTRAWMSKP
jgi:hypothetical protein